jgi:ribosomal protein S18 acetylase RimI-like enzyme
LAEVAPALRRIALPISASLQEAIESFSCLGEQHAEDPVAENVNAFLSKGRFRYGLRHDVSATYLWFDPGDEVAIIGYTTLTFDSVRLTNTEKKRMEGLSFSDFGALRIQMIGIDHRHQGKGHGTKLLQSITGLARKLSEDVSLRFLLADANVRKVGWYEGLGFVANQAKREVDRVDPERSVSMRLDLLNDLHGADSEGVSPQPETATRS